MSKPRLLIKYDYTNQQIKVEPREEVSDQELLELGKGLFEILKRYDPNELDYLNTKLNELDQVLRDVQSVIRFLRYTGGQK